MAITTTAGDLIAASLKLIGVLAQGEEPDASMSADALDRLNQWIDATQIQALMALVTERTVYDLVANQADYTIGPLALTPDFSTGTKPRPSSLAAAGLLLNTASPAVEIPLVPMTEQAYEALGIKDYDNPQPTAIFYNPTMPTGSVFLWPTPTTADNDLVLYTPLVTAQFADLSTPVTLPPGYARMFRTNLAVELAPEYGRQIDPAIRMMAFESLNEVKRANVQMMDLSIDPGLAPTHRPTYNIWSDQG